ncbi:MAG: DDE-type integrase/transposase/recombinase [Candidatus Nitrosocosmicus sp.]
MDTEVPSKKDISLEERNEISEYIVDETLLKAGSELVWLWVAIEPKNSQILAQSITQERNMFVAERFLSSVVNDYGKHRYPQMEGHGIHKPVNF